MPAKEPNDFTCSLCGIILRESYAYCTTCGNRTFICQKCLSMGGMFDKHDTHTFVMMRLDFNLLEGGWTAAEELNLLDSLNVYGPDDWESVANYVGGSHSASDCKKHYLRSYHSVPSYRLNPFHIAHRASSHDPPRFQPSSVLHNAFSGYSAARGEFKTDYDNEAEKFLSNMDNSMVCEPLEEWDNEDIKINRKLFFAVLYGYRSQLKERTRHHRVISEHGLIQPQKNFLWLRRYDDATMQWGSRGGERPLTSISGVTSQMAKTLTKFAQFLSAVELDSLLEGLKREADLKMQLNNLYELRRNGIFSLQIAIIYKRLLQRREEFLKERRKYLTNPLLNWRNIIEGKLGKYPHIVAQQRRPAPPLDISKLPGNEKLNGKERELCSVARIVPDSFIEFRNILIAECVKQGGLRLAQARGLIKIDVNKTRKLYDFLIQEGSIYQP